MPKVGEREGFLGSLNEKYPPPPPDPPWVPQTQQGSRNKRRVGLTVDEVDVDTLEDILEPYVVQNVLAEHEEWRKRYYQEVDSSGAPNPDKGSAESKEPSSTPCTEHKAPLATTLHILPAELKNIETRCGMAFTVNASTLGDEFFSKSLEREHVWMKPPTGDIKSYLNYYVAQKEKDPGTSACILLPKWSLKSHRALSDMKIVAEYPKGCHILKAADSTRAIRLPWPAVVLFDPPAPSLPHSTSNMSMLYKCKIGNAKATCLLDTGARDGPYLSETACHRLGIKISQTNPAYVGLADGNPVAVLGTAKVPVHIQQYRDKLEFKVIKLSPAFDIILDDAWLKKHLAIMDVNQAKCYITHKGERITLRGDFSDSISREDMGHKVTKPLSNLQFKRVLRKGAQIVAIMHVTRTDDDITPESNSRVDQPILSAVLPCTPLPEHNPHLVPKDKLEALLKQFEDVLTDELPGLPPERPVHVTIPLEPGTKPIYRPMFRYSPREMAEMERQVKDLLSKGLIEPSHSPFGAPVMFVEKPDKSLRMVQDYRALNQKTVRSKYPLPRIDHLLDQLKGAKVFSSLDLLNGFWQLRIADEDIPKTAFRTPFGSFAWKVLPMGLTNSPQIFSSVMADMFQGSIGKTCFGLFRLPSQIFQVPRGTSGSLRANFIYSLS